MIGPELAALLAPFAKWGAIALIVLLGGMGLWRAIVGGRERAAVDRDDLEELEALKEDRDEAEDELDRRSESALARLRANRKRLREQRLRKP